MNNDDHAIEFDPSVGISAEQVAALRDDYEKRPAELLALYEKMRETGDLNRNRLVSYRCQKGCLLLDVFLTPRGPASYKPPFSYSPKANEVTSPDARATRTTDGERRWVANVDLVLPPPLEYWLSCKHVHNLVHMAERVHSDLTERHQKPIII